VTEALSFEDIEFWSVKNPRALTAWGIRGGKELYRLKDTTSRREDRLSRLCEQVRNVALGASSFFLGLQPKRLVQRKGGTDNEPTHKHTHKPRKSKGDAPHSGPP